MTEFKETYKRTCKWMFYLMAFYVLGWGFTSYQRVFMGLLLGTACSLIILVMLYIKMNKFDKSVTSGKKLRSLGSTARLAMAAIAVMVALRWPHNFEIVGVVLGLMTNYIVITIYYVFYSFYIRKQN
ncbi:ATP synthase subunit I [Neobacillus cucumis]|jgi:ATP synthase protein I|uniref:ATP synthase subunit I n=1 Tax=Neobacillus cucumis TaxID=1740721 RepID=UPI00196597DC|nr:ATP synthase subunit I [Neobacillus cucumis]MBM7652694.1 ATP synthase protein I [Neobacillus cucumis]MED4224831.1 ATP synthase subunit I [Neobacillus cucumis]